MSKSILHNNTKIIAYIIAIWKWFPGIMFSLSHIIQMIKVHDSKNVKQVDYLTFVLFFVGNLSAYIFSQQYGKPITLLAYMLPAILEIFISAQIYKKNNTNNYNYIYILVFSFAAIFLCIYLSKYVKNKKIIMMAGVITALSVPIATILQLVKIIKDKNAHGVSARSWWLMVIGNIGNYLLIGKYKNPYNIIAFLGTALLDVIIVFITYYYEPKIKNNKSVLYSFSPHVLHY